MDQSTPARYFLGANSKNGFYSLYDGFVDPAAGDFLWVIKGGPGCGKSTLMKRVGKAAEAAGLPVEYIHCSGDPDSLDAVWLPTKRVGYVDGTAPHVTEAMYPGAASLYLDMSRFLDTGALSPLLPDIVDLNRRYKGLYAQAYALLAAGSGLLPKNLPGLWGPAEREKVEKKAAALAARELRPQGKTARFQRRFLSAVSCRGRVALEDTAVAMCGRICVLDNAFGLGHVFLEKLTALAVAYGYDGILCPDPLEPEKPEALLLPEADLAFLAEDRPAEHTFRPYRHLRLDTVADRQLLAGKRQLLRQRRRDSDQLLNRAVETLAQAKALHDELEAVYRPHVDFAGADALTETHIARI